MMIVADQFQLNIWSTSDIQVRNQHLTWVLMFLLNCCDQLTEDLVFFSLLMSQILAFFIELLQRKKNSCNPAKHWKTMETESFYFDSFQYCAHIDAGLQTPLINLSVSSCETLNLHWNVVFVHIAINQCCNIND